MGIISKIKKKLKIPKKLLLLLVAGAVLGSVGFFAAKKMGSLGKTNVEEQAEKSGEDLDEHFRAKMKDGQADAQVETKGHKKSLSLGGLIYGAVSGMHTKVIRFKRADEENERLKVENLNLRKWAEELRYSCVSEQAQNQSKEINRTLAAATGSEVGRVLASIQYRPPIHLAPDQLYTLSVSYFKGQEHEKAAVILSFLTALEDDDTYRTPANYLMTAVSWYRLEHFKLANMYLDRVLDLKPNQDVLQYQAQSRLWKAIVAERTQEHNESQEWLIELLEEHPYSIEAAWINRTEGAPIEAFGAGGEKNSYSKSKPTKAVTADEERLPASEGGDEHSDSAAH